MSSRIPADFLNELGRHRALSDIVFGKHTQQQKREAMHCIKEQSVIFKRLFEACNKDDKAALQDYVLEVDLPLLNITDFASVNGIVFCVAFPPYVSPSSNVASRRLSQISRLEKKPIAWNLMTADLSEIYETDSTLDFFFSTQQFVSRNEIDNFLDNDFASHFAWGEAAALEAQKIADVKYLYSRATPPASHIPALLYKQKNPAIEWYAEFSDPLSVTVQNEKKEMPHATTEFEMAGFWDYSDNYFENIELAVYELADILVFTNENQYELMRNRCTDHAIRKQIIEKHLILPHPQIDKRYSNIYDSDYYFNSKDINIAYFGQYFFHERKLDSFFELAENPSVMLHLFAAKVNEAASAVQDGHVITNRKISIDEIANSHDEVADRVKINKQVGYLELLNIASKMDYLYVEDLDFSGSINPYLPSKSADYLSTGTRIIAKVQEGSALSKIEHPNIIKVEQITPKFLENLKKRG